MFDYIYIIQLHSAMSRNSTYNFIPNQIPTYLPTCLPKNVHTDRQTHMLHPLHPYIRSIPYIHSIHTSLHPYIHRCINTYINTNST